MHVKYTNFGYEESHDPHLESPAEELQNGFPYLWIGETGASETSIAFPSVCALSTELQTVIAPEGFETTPNTLAEIAVGSEEDMEDGADIWGFVFTENRGWWKAERDSVSSVRGNGDIAFGITFTLEDNCWLLEDPKESGSDVLFNNGTVDDPFTDLGVVCETDKDMNDSWTLSGTDCGSTNADGTFVGGTDDMSDVLFTDDVTVVVTGDSTDEVICDVIDDVTTFVDAPPFSIPDESEGTEKGKSFYFNLIIHILYFNNLISVTYLLSPTIQLNHTLCLSKFYKFKMS